ncbi:MAG: glycosyltransferase, partial [Deltaproteobacteria bacterium]
MIDRVKVLQVIHNPGITGPGRILLGTARYLDRRFFEVEVLCPPEGGLPDALRGLGVPLIPLKYPVPSWGYLYALSGLVRKRGFHVLHVHSGQLSAFSKALGMLAGIPVIVLTEHLAAGDHSWITNGFARRVHMLSHRFSNACLDAVVAVSDTARETYIKRQGIGAEKVRTIRNGIDLGELRGGQAGPAVVVPGHLIIGAAGRLSPEKGFDVLIRAAKLICDRGQNVRFIIAGEGPEREALEKLIASLGLSGRVSLAGFCDIRSFLEGCALYVQPSREMGESFGLAVAEAMACGRPVIVSAIPAFKEIVDHGHTGMLFREGDHADLAEKILRLAQDPASRESLAGQARAYAEEALDIRVTARKTGELYLELLEARGLSAREAWVRRTLDGFMDFLERERGIRDEARLVRCRTEAEGLLRVIAGPRLDKRGAALPLESRDNFLAQLALEYLGRPDVLFDHEGRHNRALLGKALEEKEVTAKDYDERIGLQDDRFQIDNYYEPRDALMRKRVETVLFRLDPRPGESILDAGCGVGTFAYQCARKGAKCLGLDYSARSIETARRLCAGFGVEADFARCDVCGRIPAGDAGFDKIVAADFVEHITEAQKRSFLAEANRVLRPSGTLVIFTPNGIRERVGAAKELVRGWFKGERAGTRL